MTVIETEYLTYQQVQEMLGVKRRTVERYVQVYGLPKYRLRNGRVLFLRTEVEAFSRPQLVRTK